MAKAVLHGRTGRPVVRDFGQGAAGSPGPFSAAAARLAEAKAAWEGAQAEAEHAKAKAVRELLSTGLEASEVAELLGIAERELRTLRATAPAERAANVNGAGNGAVREAATMRTAS